MIASCWLLVRLDLRLRSMSLRWPVPTRVGMATVAFLPLPRWFG